MAITPLSFSSLLTQADKRHAQFKAESDARDAEMYGPGKLMRTVMRPIEQRLPPQWDAFMQALQNNGVTRMRQAPTRDTIGFMGSPGSNQIGVRNTMMAETPESLAAIDMATGGNPDSISPGELRLAPRPQFSTRPGPETGLGVRQRSLGPTNSTAQSKLKVAGQRGGAYKGTR